MISGLASNELAQHLRGDPRPVVVIDDDPTGTQTVSSVDLVLRPGVGAYDDFFRSDARALYVLSNSRALGPAAATALVREITEQVREAAAACGRSVALVYRGDSTLRGHVFAESDGVGPDHVMLFVPAFPEGGRITVDGVQWLVDGGRRIAVVDTEFAQDQTFGFSSRSLVEWVREVGPGRSPVVVPIAAIRSTGAGAVRDALLGAPAGSVVIPEAEHRADVEAAVCGLLEAEAAGGTFVVRTASTFAALRAGLDARPIPSYPLDPPRRVLVVCGSHTLASTLQLTRLAAWQRRPVDLLPTGLALAEGGAGEDILGGIAKVVQERLANTGLAILATERERSSEHGDPDSGQRVMSALTRVVAMLRDSCDGVIVKGGITAADVARDGFGAHVARVLGQVAIGVPLWEIPVGDRTIPYAVVPGNVGTTNALVDVARVLGVRA